MTTTSSRTGALTALASAGLGGLSLAAWRAEIVLLKGEEGLRWLEGFPSAAHVGIACAVLSTLLPVRLLHKVRLARAALFGLVAYGLALLSFDLARDALYAIHSGSAVFMALAGKEDLARQYVQVQFAYLAAAVLLTSVGFPLAIRLLLAPLRWWAAGLFLLAIALVMPLGMLTIRVLPGSVHTDYFQVIKLGYPVFWTSVLLGLASWLGARATTSAPPSDR